MNIGRFVILGDSYSTFEGCMPEGHETWYVPEGVERNLPTDVFKKEDTWWYQFIAETGSELVYNTSWSGSTICNTGYDGADFSNRSFVTRMDDLIKKDFFEKNNIDTLIIFGGTNDSWSDAPLGELKYEGWSKEDLYKVLPAVTYLLRRAKSNLLKVRIIFVLNDGLKEEINKTVSEACRKYEIELIKLHDIDKISDHPSIKGMKQINEQIKNYLKGEV